MRNKFSNNRILLSLLVFLFSPLCFSSSGINVNCSATLDAFPELVKKVLSSENARAGASFAIGIYSQEGIKHCSSHFQGDTPVYPASSIKTLIAFATLRKVDSGELNLDDLVTINQINAPTECLDWGCSVYGYGKRVSLNKLLWDMITVSNNLATNQLIDLTGREFITETASLLGMKNSRVVRKMYNRVDPEPEIKIRNQASALDYLALYEEIALGSKNFLSIHSRDFIKNLLKNQVYHDGLDKTFPVEIPFFNKPGETSKTLSDAGYYHFHNNSVIILSGLLSVGRSVGGLKYLNEIGYRSYHLVKEALMTSE